MHIVLGANPEADQPWVADAVADLVRQSGGSVAVVAVDEVELERLTAVPRSVFVERAEQAASAAVRRLAAVGIEASQTVRSGRPLQQILEFADEERADLIVVGSSTRPAVAARLLGSLPLALIRKSPRPVLVVTHPRDPH
ncbi:universal stress protein [Micromonospora sp. WMMD1102]|uniref:universal stress protein n=1 Tax=Micromonospora sp. WMMD1102 TaxID=3016105 RepID=UPI0024158D65|nr:universal stress protein [Micromonospora sp. WMMD1102]MDG4786039.1 universal stress protein [Micromonospora sp. WMMD1102]